MKVRARPRKVPGGWAQVHLRTGRRVGYCAAHTGPPHATADEAAACWRKYLLEQTLSLNGTRAAPGPCKVCGTMTNRTVVINGYPRDHWCDEHRTVERVTAWWNAATAGTPQSV